MNKIGLRKIIYKKFNAELQHYKNKKRYSKKESIEILEVVLNSIFDSLVSTKRLTLRDIGILEIINTKDRKGWNPSTKEHMIIKGRPRIKFIPAAKLKMQLT